MSDFSCVNRRGQDTATGTGGNKIGSTGDTADGQPNEVRVNVRPSHEPLLIWEGGTAGPLGSAAARPAPYTQLGRAVPQVSNRLYRRFPNRQAVQGSKAPACGAASGLGNPRYRRLGSLRYQKAASSRPLYLKTIDACKGQRPRAQHVEK